MTKADEAADVLAGLHGFRKEPVVFTYDGPVPMSEVQERLAEAMRKKTSDDGTLRTFPSGATRDTAEGKLEPWGFTSALVEKAFCEYMHRHRVQSDGSLRDSDNWKKGFELGSYWHSMSRHVLDFRLLWEGHQEEARTDDMVDALCGILFNVQGLIHELKKKTVVV